MMPRATKHRDDHVTQNTQTYDLIAEHYWLTAMPDLRARVEESIRVFFDYLPGKRVLVPGCGDGRDSRYLASLGLQVTSFDISEGMLRIAAENDPAGAYLKLDLRDIAQLPGPFDGIWASGCLYHLTKAEFSRCVDDCGQLLSQRGILYLSMKQGRGERYRSVPGPNYPGGPKARKFLRGRRFYSYYKRDELLGLLRGFDLLKIQDLRSGEAGFALWMRRSIENRAEATS